MSKWVSAADEMLEGVTDMEGEWINSDISPRSRGVYWGLAYFVNRAYVILFTWGGREWLGEDGGPFYWWSEPVKIPAVPYDIRAKIDATVDSYRRAT